MPKYLLVVKPDDQEPYTQFYDNYNDAANAYMNCECGFGWYAELYAYTRENPEDELEPESYLLIM